MEKIDVLILNKDYEIFLEKCLDSVLTQTHTNTNIIVVDDNSKDNSRNILKKYKNKLTLIEVNDGQPNISKTRNILLQNLSSNYCTFLSSDDYFDKFFLEKQLEILSSTKNNIGGVYSNFYWVNIDGNIISEVKHFEFETKELLNSAIAKPDCIITFESTLFKSSVFENVKFDLDICHGEETYMGFLLSKKYHFLHNDSFLAFKTKHSSQGHEEFKKNINHYQKILVEKMKNV